MIRRSAIGALLAAAPALAQSVPAPEVIHSRGNPILADGRVYSTDPAPFVDGDTLWILAGRDEAPAAVDDFVMNEWQLLATTDPARGTWRHYPAVARPEARSCAIAADRFVSVRFPAIATRRLRAVFDASTVNATPAGVAVQEWEALASTARVPSTAPKAAVPACGREPPRAPGA